MNLTGSALLAFIRPFPSKRQLNLEVVVGNGLNGYQGYSFSNLLAQARESYVRGIRGAGTGLDESLDRLKELGFLIKRSEQVFVEPGEGRIEKGDGEDNFEPRRYSPRLEELVAGL